MQTLSKISASSIEPVGLQDMLNYLRVDAGTDDDVVSELITAARQYAETFQRTSLVSEQYRLTLDHFPFFILRDGEFVYDIVPEWEGYPNLPGGLLYPSMRRFAIELPRTPLVSVDAFTYLDPTGTQQAFASPANYQTVTSDDVAALIYPADGTYWPPTLIDPEAVSITFTAGYTDTNIPQNTVRAIRVMVAANYDDRSGANGIPPLAMSLLRLDRNFEFPK